MKTINYIDLGVHHGQEIDLLLEQYIPYQDIYNSTIRSVTNDKQLIAEGRTPASQGPKSKLDSSDLNVVINRPEIDSNNRRRANIDNIMQQIRTKEPCTVTKQKNILDNDAILERTNPEILKTFKQNPFTHSLSSYQFP